MEAWAKYGGEKGAYSTLVKEVRLCAPERLPVLGGFQPAWAERRAAGARFGEEHSVPVLLWDIHAGQPAASAAELCTCLGSRGPLSLMVPLYVGGLDGFPRRKNVCTRLPEVPKVRRAGLTIW